MCLICARFKTVQRDHFGRSLLIVIGAKLDVKNKKCALIVKINTQPFEVDNSVLREYVTRPQGNNI